MSEYAKFELDLSALKEIDRAAARALALTGEALHTEVVQAQVIPRDTGRLQNTATYVDDSLASKGVVQIISSTPYARRLYFHPEYNFHRGPWIDSKGVRHEGNANAKGHWFEDWLPGGSKSDFAQEAFEKFLKREGSDVIE